MAKKIQPKDQTEELNNARLEFILRNKEESQKLRELVCQDEKKRDEFTTALSSLGGKFNPEMKEHWDFLTKVLEIPFDKEFAEYIKKEEVPKAVNSVWRWLDYVMEVGHERMATVPGISDQLNYEELKTKVIDMCCRDARGIFTKLTNDKPATHLLLGIDLTRSKGVILGEVGKLIDEYQTKLGVHELPEKRLKWLPNVPELLEVWDLYEAAGKTPIIQSFRNISRKVGRPLSTVKDQWYAAYEQVHRKPYDPESKSATEETRADADALCANCPHGAKCYRQKEWVGCAAYQKIAGRERKGDLEYRDDILYQ